MLAGAFIMEDMIYKIFFYQENQLLDIFDQQMSKDGWMDLFTKSIDFFVVNSFY